LSLRNKIKYLNLEIFRTRSCKPLIFQTQIIWSNRIHSLKYLRSATFGSKDIVIRKSEFVAKTQFLCFKIVVVALCLKLICPQGWFEIWHFISNFALIYWNYVTEYPGVYHVENLYISSCSPNALYNSCFLFYFSCLASMLLPCQGRANCQRSMEMNLTCSFFSLQSLNSFFSDCVFESLSVFSF